MGKFIKMLKRLFCCYASDEVADNDDVAKRPLLRHQNRPDMDSYGEAEDKNSQLAKLKEKYGATDATLKKPKGQSKIDALEALIDEHCGETKKVEEEFKERNKQLEMIQMGVAKIGDKLTGFNVSGMTQYYNDTVVNGKKNNNLEPLIKETVQTAVEKYKAHP